jgi:hypothetical protein
MVNRETKKAGHCPAFPYLTIHYPLSASHFFRAATLGFATG